MHDQRLTVEVTAPTIEEAIARGAAELGVAPDAVDVQVLDEGGKGMFGLGLRQPRVRLTVKAAVSSEAREVRPTPRIPEASEVDDDEALRVTIDTLDELLQRMGVDAKVLARWGEPTGTEAPRNVLVDLHGTDLSILIGHRGETLSALQYITRLIVGKELQHPLPIVLDVEGYRARREKQLRQLAQRMAQQAIERGRTMTLEPMPANERRIIHIELRDHAQVTTESIGEGDHRKVTIIPRP
ncbi:MAG: protein jag [Chloroflexi bacterium]|nr:protein jag [Chloroflexota bacterium]